MRTTRVIAPLLLAALVASCTGGADSNTLAGAIEQEKQARRVKAIKPPPPPDLTRNGQVGLILDTNSGGWRRVLGTPAESGAVVLFVVADSPAALAGFVRGDVIVQVGPTRTRNDERARVALRGRSGVPLAVRVRRRSETLNLSVVPSAPSGADLVALYDQALATDPRDATTLLLRAQLTSDPQQALSFIDRALDVQPDFVEALISRARLFWTESETVANEAVIIEDQRRAREDFDRAVRIDPRATAVYITRGTAFAELQGFADAERDALRAIAIDASYPSAYLLLARTRLELARPRDAATPADQAVRLTPYDAEPYRILAITFLALGRRDDAQETIRVGLTVAESENERATLRALLDR